MLKKEEILLLASVPIIRDISSEYNVLSSDDTKKITKAQKELVKLVIFVDGTNKIEENEYLEVMQEFSNAKYDIVRVWPIVSEEIKHDSRFYGHAPYFNIDQELLKLIIFSYTSNQKQ